MEKNSLENLCSRLHQNFPRSEHFKVGTALVTLLQTPDLLASPSQRLAAVTFLYDMYKHTAVANNPFAPVFIQLLSPPDSLDQGEEMRSMMPRLNPAEKQFLTQLVAGQGKEFMKRTAAAVTTADTVSVPSVDLTGFFLKTGILFRLFFSGVQLSLAETQSQLPHTARAAVTAIIPDPAMPQDPAAAHASAAQRRTIEAGLNILQ